MTESTEEVDPLQALGRAADSAAKKDDLTVTALESNAKVMKSNRRRSITNTVLSAVIALGVLYVAWEAHDQNARSAKNSTVLFCVADSEADVSRDLHTLIESKAKAPASAYKIPANCALLPGVPSEPEK